MNFGQNKVVKLTLSFTSAKNSTTKQKRERGEWRERKRREEKRRERRKEKEEERKESLEI